MDNQEKTALDKATEKGHEEIVKFLREKEVDRPKTPVNEVLIEGGPGLSK